MTPNLKKFPKINPWFWNLLGNTNLDRVTYKPQGIISSTKNSRGIQLGGITNLGFIFFSSQQIKINRLEREERKIRYVNEGVLSTDKKW